MIPTKRLRMFAGPNGSGKSTIKDIVSTAYLGHYLNPDDIERQLKQEPIYRVDDYNFPAMAQSVVRSFFTSHPLAVKANLSEVFANLNVYSQSIDFGLMPINSYIASILTDYLRGIYLESGQSFTFETVMSSPDKLAVLKRAKDAGFRIYLYYVATEDPTINIERVQLRTQSGGHSVPTNKIIERYYRSLDYLFDAIRLSGRAYLFDNSGQSRSWIAEVTNGTDIDLKTEYVPTWFLEYVLNKVRPYI
ncbi:zeta toxin family protein [Spirosoma fluviale]|uniref:Predicted ABC-type ATPase n=1 Tax=Spirosoma fluviale TaxID=1597977 RepID=A0A286FBC4_9BACT|nr:zeta toxin family protein [Spirosoma fluviale]SOD80289.1 Predicted ABC-type ATPase [Spirosoma fluviale]